MKVNNKIIKQKKHILLLILVIITLLIGVYQNQLLNEVNLLAYDSDHELEKELEHQTDYVNAEHEDHEEDHQRGHGHGYGRGRYTSPEEYTTFALFTIPLIGILGYAGLNKIRKS